MAALAEALLQLTATVAHHDSAVEGFSTFLDAIAAATGPSPPQIHARPKVPAPPPAQDPPRVREPRPDRDVDRLRADLPPPLNGRGSGRKTHGRWFVGNRPARAIVSGEDDGAKLAASYLARIGEQRAAVRAHVEIKLAALIRQRYESTGLTAHATVVINNEICGGDKSCPAFLPWLLPPGCSITVVTPTSQAIFTGEAT